MFIICFSFWQEIYYGRHQVLGIGHRALNAGLPDAGVSKQKTEDRGQRTAMVTRDQQTTLCSPHAVICLLTSDLCPLKPDTRHPMPIA